MSKHNVLLQLHILFFSSSLHKIRFELALYHKIPLFYKLLITTVSIPCPPHEIRSRACCCAPRPITDPTDERKSARSNPSPDHASPAQQAIQTEECDAHHKAAGRRCLAPRTRRSGFGAAELESHLSSTNNHGLRGYRGYGFTNSSCNTRRKEGDDPGSAIRDAEGYLQACKSGRFPKAEP